MKRESVKTSSKNIIAPLAMIVLALGSLTRSQTSPPLSEAADVALGSRIQRIMDRPEFRHAFFGIEFYSLDTGKPIYSLNADKLFTPGSTTKLLTEGTALELLGADYRFHTRVYRTGNISQDGTLDGDLILVASGDPNLSGRIQPDGTLAFENEDHAYDGSPDTRAVPGDPLMVIRELAKQIAARRIKKVTGHVFVDASLFPEGDRELGTGVVMSPIVVNDNILDLTIGPGSTEGAAAVIRQSPVTSYASFVNKVTTGKADSRPDIDFTSDIADQDGSHKVTVSGSFPAGKPGILYKYVVPVPTRFAETVLTEALRENGVTVSMSDLNGRPDFKALASNYVPDRVVAEHISPPLSEEVKVTLKVSQNLHASSTPMILGAILSPKDKTKNGFDLEREFLTRAGLDLTGAQQGDGAGGNAHFTPEFMVSYLAYMARQKDYPLFFKALPVLGRDGTLFNIQTTSPAAGYVHAKTGTYADGDPLNRRLIVTGKGLAGYMTTAGGRHLAFAIYVNNVSVPPEAEAITEIGQALGEIAAAAYQTEATPQATAPPPAPERWRGLIGEYGTDKSIVYILESDGKLCASFARATPECLSELSESSFKFTDTGTHANEQLLFTRDAKKHATRVRIGEVTYARRQIGPEEGAPQLHVAPVRPVKELIKEALTAQPPKETGDFRKPDLVELTRLDPTIKLDIRYATTNNFLGTVFYSEPRAFMQRPAAEAVVRVNQKLKKLGYGLLVHDAYRPWYITKVFWDATPVDKHIFVADPAQGSRHNRGCAVDLTLYDLKTGKPVEMVSTYDETTDRAYPDYPGGTSLQRWHRKLLRDEMESEGFTVYEAEWWHFDYQDWQHYPIGNETFEKLDAAGR